MQNLPPSNNGFQSLRGQGNFRELLLKNLIRIDSKNSIARLPSVLSIDFALKQKSTGLHRNEPDFVSTFSSKGREFFVHDTS
jgi:hypothetical protein